MFESRKARAASDSSNREGHDAGAGGAESEAERLAAIAIETTEDIRGAALGLYAAVLRNEVQVPRGNLAMAGLREALRSIDMEYRYGTPSGRPLPTHNGHGAN